MGVVTERGGHAGALPGHAVAQVGVRPRGDQVRRTGGISEMPGSSKKTSQAGLARALF
jgi:hypothetical protein